MRKLLWLIVLVSALTACGDGGKYVVNEDNVVYTHWTFSFGQVYDTVAGADPKTFTIINKWLGHDATQVFFKTEKVPGAVVEGLKAKRIPLFCDKNDYFYETSPLHVADMKSFKVVKWIDDDFWAKDSRYVYYDSTRIDGADVATFKTIKWWYACDKNHVYYGDEILPGADPATFKLLKNTMYGKDKSHVYCGPVLLEDADYATFTVDDMFTAHDKYGTFNDDQRDTLGNVVPGEETTE